MDMSEYKEIFKAESEEHLQQLNDSLLGLEQNPNDLEYINTMFRSAHTLKGMSATMGFSTIAELTHEMENLMDMVRKSQVEVSNGLIDILFECLDTLEALVEAVDSGEEVDIAHLQATLAQAMEGTMPVQEIKGSVTASIDTIQNEIGKEIPENTADAETKTDVAPVIDNVELSDNEKQAIQDAIDEGNRVVSLKVILDESCVLKSARSTLVLINVSKMGEIIKCVPTEAELEDEKFDLEFSVIFATKSADEDIVGTIKKISEIKDVIPTTVAETSGVEEKQQEKKSEETEEKKNTSAVKRSDAVKSIQSVRVNIERLDNLMNLVGELIINKIRLNQLASDLNAKDLDESLANLDRLTNEIQTEVMESRMVPIDQIFSRFPRMVRDLAKSEGKQINLIIEGKEIELDRTVLDEIGDPLVHLLRNAVDHGIESEQERKQLGKPVAGLVRLAASRQRNSVLIEVEDDGKGMEPGHLRDIAVKKGLLTREEVDKLSDNDALNLIFMPGFSGAKVVTDISGRGVGMDAVKTKIEALGGSVKISSVPGQGSIMKLQLPLTVAIIQSLMVTVAGETYAIPLGNVIRDVGIKASDIKTIEGKEVIMLRGEVLPLLRLHDVLECPTEEEEKQNLIVVVVEKMGSNIGLVVDDLLGQQEVIIKTLDNKLLKNMKGFAGATILGDGSVALILDIATLI
ncbi:two-component system, chemotaxis family, sensor kinase CheA [Methanolobus vulcani]|jgi:two-component system chemotaxis sensor kinase CheA|uniref:Chemotaxis protein CheA n=1 Tax=Methanolobus vulcani TaxID=38026 RepID=A0A7Z7B1U6_9EURY|nr:chemotaxis protein CheA [Methanolobus vulcani]SDF86228.1 two-component system, chemotaxis family, sensor kinase CheA [Methanolobus vulcani]